MRFIVVFFIVSGLLLAQSPSVPAGTLVRARLETTVKTANATEGDAVLAVVAESVLAGKRVIVPRGSELHGRVETVEPATQATEGRVRLVFREIQFPDGRRVSTWMTNSFTAPSKNNARYPAYMGIGGAAGALVGGTAGRVAGIIGGTLAGFVIAGHRNSASLRDLTLKTGREIPLQLGEDLDLTPIPTR